MQRTVIFHCIRVNVVSYTNISPNIYWYHAWCWLHTQTSVYIFQCEPMFARAAIGSSKHRYTLKNVNRFLRFENIEKTTFYLIQWEYPNSGSVISEIWPSCFEMGVNVTPPACGRRGTLTPHFSAYRAIFSDMTSPELGYCLNVLCLSKNSVGYRFSQ